MAETLLKVILSGDAAGAVRAFKEVATSSAETATKTESHSSVIGKAFKSVGAAAIPVIGAALGIGAAAIEMSDKWEVSRARLEGAIKSTGGNFDQLRPSISKVDQTLEHLGFSNTDTEASLATLTRASGSSVKALSLMGLAADVARGRNIDLGTATNILAKVTTGHVALLGRLGINTKDATGKTISQTEAIKRLSALYGGQAKTSAETFAGKQQVLKAELEDAGVKIGTKLTPVIVKLADVFTTDIIPAIDKTVGWVENSLIPAVQGISKAVGDWIDKNKTAAIVIAAIVAPIPTLVAAIIYAWKNFEGFRDAVHTALNDAKNIVRDFVGAVEAFWRTFGDSIISYTKGAWTAIQKEIQGVLNIVGGIVKFWQGVFAGDWGKAWQGVVQTLRGIFGLAVGAVQGIISQVLFVLQAGWAAVGRGVINAWDAIIGWFRGLPGRIVGAIGNIAGAFFGLGQQIVQGIINGIEGAAGNIGGVVKGLLSRIPGAGLLSHLPGIGGLFSGDVGGWIPGAKGAPLLMLGHGGEYIMSRDELAGRPRSDSPLRSVGAVRAAPIGGSAGGGLSLVVNVNGGVGDRYSIAESVTAAVITALQRGTGRTEMVRALGIQA